MRGRKSRRLTREIINLNVDGAHGLGLIDEEYIVGCVDEASQASLGQISHSGTFSSLPIGMLSSLLIFLTVALH